MYESVVSEHIPKTATAKNTAKTGTNENEEAENKLYFLMKTSRSGDQKQNIFFWCGLRVFPNFHTAWRPLLYLR